MGASYITVIHPPATRVKSGRRSDTGQEARTREIFKVPRLGGRSSFAGATRLGRRALLPGSVNQDRSANTVHISQYEFHSTQRSSLAHHKPQLDGQTACSCLQGELGSPRPNFIRCQPACAAPHAANAASGTPRAPRAPFACRASGAENAGRRDLLSTSSLPGTNNKYQSMYARFVPFLRVSSTVLCAPPTSKQAPKPAGLPPAWSPAPCPLSFFARS